LAPRANSSRKSKLPPLRVRREGNPRRDQERSSGKAVDQQLSALPYEKQEQSAGNKIKQTEQEYLHSRFGCGLERLCVANDLIGSILISS
jgi:hypothetical protein